MVDGMCARRRHQQSTGMSLGQPAAPNHGLWIVTGSAWINGEIASRALLAMQEATVGATSQALRHIRSRARLHQIGVQSSAPRSCTANICSLYFDAASRRTNP